MRSTKSRAWKLGAQNASQVGLPWRDNFLRNTHSLDQIWWPHSSKPWSNPVFKVLSPVKPFSLGCPEVGTGLEKRGGHRCQDW